MRGAQPPFYLQIADENGAVVKTRYGGAHERLLIDSIVEKVISKGVGFFRSQADVEMKLRDAITEVISEIKIKNPFDTL